MDSSEIIEHEAFIREIKDSKLIVDVLSKSACLSCQLKGLCSIADIEEKAVEVERDLKKNYEIGQKVNVYFSRNKSLMAVFWGYVLPFLLIFITLIIALQITNKDGLSGIISLSILIPYYIILYLFRNKISSNYKFKLKD